MWRSERLVKKYRSATDGQLHKSLKRTHDEVSLETHEFFDLAGTFSLENDKISRSSLLAAIRSKELNFEQLSPSSEFTNDREVVLEMIKAGESDALLYSSLKHDRDVVLAAAKIDGDTLHNVLSKFEGDREIAIAAVTNKSSAMRAVPPSLLDRELVLASLTNGNTSIGCLFDDRVRYSNHLDRTEREDEVLPKRRAQLQEMSLEEFHAKNEALYLDPEIIERAIDVQLSKLEVAEDEETGWGENGWSFESKEVVDIISRMARREHPLFFDRSFILKLLSKQDIKYYNVERLFHQYNGNPLLNDISVMSSAIRISASVFENAGAVIQDSKDIARIAINNQRSMIEFVSDRLKEDVDLAILTTIDDFQIHDNRLNRKFQYVYRYLGSAIKENPQFVKIALSRQMWYREQFEKLLAGTGKDDPRDKLPESLMHDLEILWTWFETTNHSRDRTMCVRRGWTIRNPNKSRYEIFVKQIQVYVELRDDALHDALLERLDWSLTREDFSYKKTVQDVEFLIKRVPEEFEMLLSVMVIMKSRVFVDFAAETGTVVPAEKMESENVTEFLGRIKGLCEQCALNTRPCLGYSSYFDFVESCLMPLDESHHAAYPHLEEIILFTTNCRSAIGEDFDLSKQKGLAQLHANA